MLHLHLGGRCPCLAGQDGGQGLDGDPQALRQGVGLVGRDPPLGQSLPDAAGSFSGGQPLEEPELIRVLLGLSHAQQTRHLACQGNAGGAGDTFDVDGYLPIRGDLDDDVLAHAPTSIRMIIRPSAARCSSTG